MSESNKVDRRDFLRVVLTFLGTVMGAFVAIPAIGYLIAPALKVQKREAWVPLGNLDAFPVGTPTLASFTRSKVNGWEKTVNSYGVFVLRKSDTEVLVLSNKCTHLGCRVNWNQERDAYVCPCHDAQFDINGKVLAGPPPRPLDAYTGDKVKIEDGVVSIDFEEG